MRVAIIGSGPAGFYAAEALLKRTDITVDVDLFDRLPTPYGLVRGGVAPDHQDIKNVTQVFERTAARPTFRFLGNVQLGCDVTVEDLRAHYDQIVYATGNESDRRLGIPGEGIPRCTPASVFVGWYNGHPDYRPARFDFSDPRIAVIGNGNVAVDVARILMRSPAELERTDIASHALDALLASRIREVLLIGRRGPAQAAFTAPELKELGELEDADPSIDPGDLVGLDDLEGAGTVAILKEFAVRKPRPRTKRIRFLFLRSPIEIIAGADGGVSGIVLERNRLEARPGRRPVARGIGELERIDVGSVLPAVGYAADPIPGVPHDAQRRVVANEEGRVVDPVTRTAIPNEYVVGWARTGAQGLIGEHKKGSAQVVSLMVDDARGLRKRALPPRDAIDVLLRRRGVRVVSFADWRRLDEVEVARGARRGAPRDKISDVDAMIRILAG